MFDAEFAAALHAITSAAEIQRRAHESRDFAVSVKPDMSLVTTTDRACEEAVTNLLADRFPEDGILAEESGRMREGTSGRTWVVDPLDGTRYFTLGFPEFGPFLALKDQDGTIFGMVMDAMSGVLWWARRGAGSFRRRQLDWPDQRLNAPEGRQIPSLSNAMVSFGGAKKLWGSGISLDRLAPRVGSWLNISPFRGFTAVAEGRLDAFVGSGLKEWDILPLEIIVQEAGGHVIRLPRNGMLHVVVARTSDLAQQAEAAFHECTISSDDSAP